MILSIIFVYTVKPVQQNLLGTSSCVQDRLLSLQVRLTKMSYISTFFKVQFTQDFVQVQVRQVLFRFRLDRFCLGSGQTDFVQVQVRQILFRFRLDRFCLGSGQTGFAVFTFQYINLCRDDERFLQYTEIKAICLACIKNK